MDKRKRRQYLSVAEIGTVLLYVKIRADLARRKGTTRAIIDELIVLLLAQAGLRPNELCSLKIGDFFQTNGEMAIWIRDRSGVVTRKVDIHENAAERLARFVDLYRNQTQATDFLLESERGTPLGYMSLYSRLRRIGRETGIDYLSPATLRRTYIQELYRAQGDLRYVQQQAGYASRRSIARAIKIDHDANATDRGSTEQPFQAGSEPVGMGPMHAQTCEACGTMIVKGRGKRIESGQLICDGCLKYFRRA